MFKNISANRLASIKKRGYKIIKINKNTYIIFPKIYGWIELLKMIPKLIIIISQSIFELMHEIFFIIKRSLGNIFPWIIRVEDVKKI